MRRFFCNALLLLLASAVTEASSDTCSIVAEQAQIQDIIDWVRSEGGFFNDKLEVRRADPADPTSYYGIFATNTIQPKEALLRVSASSMIRAVKDEQQVSDEEHASELCDLTHVVLKELRSGEQSQYAPYVKYLLDQKRGQLPSSWTEPAKELMREINPADVHNMVDWIEMEFENTGCIRKGDAFEQQALALVVQRRWESIMVPVYDIISNAKDPKKINMDTTSVFGPKGLRTWATTLIEAGEELFTSYSNVWGTSEILRNFGFVEPYPRKFQMSQVLFEIDEAIGETGDTSQEIEWINLDGETPSYEAIESMKEESKRLQDLQHNGTLEDNRRMMPEKEWNVIFQYHQALANAVDVAIELATGDLHAADNHCDEDGNCGIRYEDLNEEIQSSDDYYFMTYQCETLAFGIDHFLTVGKSESHYQLMNYYHDPETKEMCFHIDGVHQQCTSYRPHYHEMGVHLPARYLPEGLKRVLWIGGGDAMLLHEFLKYPELELAVGLELDQKVTRGAFKYFGAQPHWDNEKVQWWYGDASKSLLMLPEDYFGSFDMVLVDLSDTVLSLSVTKEMDIIGALSLLLKPDGIFVMNELFFKRVSEVFENTVQIHIEHVVPKICDQAFVLASNRIDFLSHNLTGHDIEDNLYIKPFDAENDFFDLVHDYRRNHDSGFMKLCKNDHEDDGGVLEQEGSTGIFMAVEAEEVTMDLHSMKDVQDAVIKALEKEGFKVDSIAESQHVSDLMESASAETVLVLREGYVAIRTWPEQNYCAFDIHLWSSFEKHDAAKTAVVASVGGMMENASSYRIVAGGMFGLSTWKDDAKVHGPQLDKLCDRSEPPARDAPIDPSTLEVALEAALRLTRDEDPVIAAVVCRDSEACATIDLLKKNDNVGQVVVLMCPELKPGDELFQDGPEHAIACEKEILKTFKESLTDEKLLGAVVVDGGATRLMGQIVLKILTDSKSGNAKTLFSLELIAIATIDNEETESWKRNFLDEVRREVIRLDPVFRTEILLNTTDSSMELGITASGDEHFIQHLTDTFASVRKESGLSVEVRRFHGGLWRADTKTLMDDSEADYVYSHGSYDRTAPMEQWRSQTPLAHQSLLQFETRPLRVGDNIGVTFAEDEEMYEGVVELVNDDDTYYVKFVDGDFGDAVERIEIRKLHGSPNDEMLTATQVKDGLKLALSSMPLTKMAEQAYVEELTSTGDGSVLSAFWPGGSMLVMWDGRTHVDINLVTYFESSLLAQDFAINLQEAISGLETILLDEQPRGFGRVVNFRKDLKSLDPYWA